MMLILELPIFWLWMTGKEGAQFFKEFFERLQKHVQFQLPGNTGSMDTDAAIYQKIHSRLLAFLTQVMKSEQVANETLQVVLMRYWKKQDEIARKGFEDYESLENYLFTIARNCGRDHYRKEARRRRIHVRRLQKEAAQPNSYEIFNGICARDMYRVLQTTLDALSMKIFIYRLEGHTCKEIAYLEQLSVATVEHKLKVARQKLRKQWLSGSVKE